MWQGFSDFFTFIGWLWTNIVSFVDSTLLPARYVFSFIKSFVGQAVSTPVTADLPWNFDQVAGLKSLIFSIPYIQLIFFALAIGILLIAGFMILKHFAHI